MNMEFVEMRDMLIEHFNEITKNSEKLFQVECDKDELWNTYLDSFTAGHNDIFRERRWHDCSCCRQFIKNIGNVVTIKNGVMHSIWDFKTNDDTYQPVLTALSKFVKSKKVCDMFLSNEKKVGTKQNFEKTEDEKILTWDHFFLELDNKFVNTSIRSREDIYGEFRDSRNVFKRSLDELTNDSVESVIELIASNTLYRGEQWGDLLKKFLEIKKEYNKLSDKKKELFAWEKVSKVPSSVAKIRNTSIGTLLINISENMDLDTAVGKYEAVVAPINYKRSKPIYTKKMLEDAKKTIMKLGFMDSLQRRFANIDDITINDVLFSNRNVKSKLMQDDDLFASMEKSIAINPKKFSRVEEIGIEDFIKNVLPVTSELEVLLENKLTSNLCSLIAPINKDSKTMFKWNNNFSWAYSGNIADSDMKQRVKAAGGKVDGVLRFSIQWNDIEGEWDKNDLDAHCKEPASGQHIYFSHMISTVSGGQLDVDNQNPSKNIPAVENITWTDTSKMKLGNYEFFVNQYANRGGKHGFRAEIEFNGEIYSYDYPYELKTGENVSVATVCFDGNNFSIVNSMDSTSKVASNETWGLNTNQFIPVTLMCMSPNYWDKSNGTGNKHYMFMLKDCVNTENPSSFYNEYLNEELRPHRKVLEALGSKAAVQDTDEQLSGLGFSSTRRNELVVKVKGVTERVMRIKF